MVWPRSTRRIGLRLFSSAVGIAVAGCAGVTASDAGSQPSSNTERCLPAWPTATPRKVAAGDPVVLRDHGLRCNPFSRPQTYTVVLIPPRKPGGLPDYGHERRLASFRVGTRGAFSVVIRLPSSTPRGSAQLGVRGSELDRRLRCPSNASCRFFGAGIVITR